ncbi:protein of unknown function [Haloechinothrix alba]|uniref:Bacteriocin-protection, YdeI or OmpD-Associated n=1 Tax=Haloechinothrix alba TaxID=664784 RepID=A0A238WII5_9PSEU|nr:DUF1905 domain-containing protein [Haloechinothrix alba]SNR45489.1 protein of unknown function [Haloechinothrix alba]
MDPVTVEVTLQPLEGAASSAFAPLELDVAGVFGDERPWLRVTVNDHEFRSAVVVSDTERYIPLNRANCEMAGVAAGDTVAMTLELVSHRHHVPPPDDLLLALGDARARWDALPGARQESLTKWVADAATDEIRRRRIARIVEEVRG